MQLFDRDSIQRSTAEALREMGILLTVFGPLDGLFTSSPGTHGTAVAVACFGLMFLISGVLIEAHHHRRRS